MNTLRYPTEAGGAAAPDYVEFVPSRYRPNNTAGGGGGGAGAAAPGETGARSVILYMPNSTPGVGNSQQWGEVNFIGPVGSLMRDIGIGAANTTYAAGGVSGIVDKFKSEMSGIYDNNKGNAGNIVRQGVLSAVAPMMSADASQLMALAKGQVYNPNVELLYKMPGMRSFNFSFNFVPKNAAEARQVNQIIRNFKVWSAPAALDSGMFEVPHVWQIKYMTGGKENPNMNKFKKAACVGVTVQANPQTTMHVAHEDGMPIETVMSLNFREVNIITRQDHRDAQGQGF